MKAFSTIVAIFCTLSIIVTVTFAADSSGSVAAEPKPAGTAAGKTKAEKLRERNLKAKTAASSGHKTPDAAATPAGPDASAVKKEVTAPAAEIPKPKTASDAAKKAKAGKMRDRNQQAKQKSRNSAVQEPSAVPPPSAK